jgi:hypothetical protein
MHIQAELQHLPMGGTLREAETSEQVILDEGPWPVVAARVHEGISGVQIRPHAQHIITEAIAFLQHN